MTTKNLEGKKFKLIPPEGSYDKTFKHKIERLGLFMGSTVEVFVDSEDKLLLKCNDFKVGIDKEAVIPFLQEI